MSKQVLAGIGLTIALGGIVGGVALTKTFEPSKPEAPMVVVPAAAVHTATPTPVASPSEIPVVKAEPITTESAAPVSSKSTTTKKASTVTVQSDTPSDPTPVEPGPVKTAKPGDLSVLPTIPGTTEVTGSWVAGPDSGITSTPEPPAPADAK